MDTERQWFKARIGLECSETARDISFCTHAVLETDILIIPDAAEDARFAASPLVLGAPYIRFYAGMPLITPQGHAVGVLCVYDTVPRTLDPVQQDSLRRLGRQVIALLEARPLLRRSNLEVQAREEAVAEQERFFALSSEILCILDSDGHFRRLNSAVTQILGFLPEEMTGKLSLDFLHPDDRDASRRAMELIASGVPASNYVNRFRCKDGTYRSILWDTAPRGDHFYAAGRDITERVLSEQSVRDSHAFLQSTLDALAAHIAVLDENGSIVAVNEAWDRFARENEGTPISCGVGTSYYEICRAVDGLWSAEANAVDDGMQSVINGQQPAFSIEYPCHTASQERWFMMRVTRFAGEGPLRVVVSHEDITLRKHVEAVLEHSELQFRAVFHNSLDANIITDNEGRFIEVNAAACELYELSREELLAKNTADFAPPGWDVASAIRDLVARGRQTVEYELHLAGDRRKFIEYAATADFLPGRHLTALRDITARRRAEMDVRSSEERLRFVSENARVGLVMLDRERRYTYANNAYSEILEIPLANVTGLQLPDVLAPLYESQIRPHLDRAFAGHRVTYELRREQADESHFYLVRYEPTKIGGEVSNVVVVITDISERKRAESALQRANDALELRVEARTAEFQKANELLRVEAIERKMAMSALRETAEAFDTAQKMLRVVMNHIPQAIFWKDRNSVYLGCNDRLAQDAGFVSPEAVVGKDDFDMPWAQYAEVYRSDDAQVMTEDRPKRNFEEPLTKADGSPAWLRTNKIPLHDAQNNVVGVLCSYEDITEQKEAEAQLLAARQEAEAANCAKSEFLSRMSHELRTPLNAILGFGQILERQELKPIAKTGLRYIMEGGQHLLVLVNEILDISRVEAGRLEVSLEPVLLSDIIPEVCALMGPLAAEGEISLSENGSHFHDDYIMADVQRLKQVLINLLANAIKYNDKKGSVEVICRPNADGHTTIAIRDTGTGMSPRDLQKLFTPFERLQAANLEIEGTGLGLVLSQRLMTAMAGTITVASELGVGSTFTISLPSAAPPPAKIEAAREVSSRDELRRTDRTFSVLCIEDNPSNLRLIEAIFESRPEFRLLTAIQGSVGLDMARQHQPDIILLDLNLPDIHGREVLARLQQSAVTREIPVVIVSADATTNQVQRLQDAGAKAYLTKPVNVEQLLLTMDTLLPGTSRTAPLGSGPQEIE